MVTALASVASMALLVYLHKAYVGKVRSVTSERAGEASSRPTVLLGNPQPPDLSFLC